MTRHAEAPNDTYAEALAAAVTLLGAPDVARSVLSGDVHPSVLNDPSVRCALAQLVLRDGELRNRLLENIAQSLAALSLAYDAVSSVGAAPVAADPEVLRAGVLNWLGEITAIRSALDDVACTPNCRIESPLT